ncbi:unnamed protein product [Sphagnum troendelagicum]|uniref:DNA-directed RNA polymerase III subunit RPC3 n=1 Tax=Sphagnum troendelagicum TaxID=128251 RepID=A0ABP0ULM1_9BRYO
MATQFGRKLACELIFSHFGESVQKVCKSLVYHGQLSLPEIAHYTKMSTTQIHNSLLVLVQHSCVQAFKVEHDGIGSAPPRVLMLYIALTDNILHCMRFPKFLVLVKEDVGDQVSAEALVEGLLEHGRLTLEQLIQRAAARAGKAEGEVATVVKDCFHRLLANHYIERCPVPEPSLCPNIAVEPAKKTACGAEVSDLAPGSISEEQRIMSAAAPTDAERFQAPVSLISMGGTHTEMGDSNHPVGQKRKREALQIDAKTAAAAAAMDEKEVLWHVNYEEFVRRLRHQACVAFVRSRIDAMAGTVLEGMLDATCRHKTSVKQHSSVPMSIEVIMDSVRNLQLGQGMTVERLQVGLQQLVSDSAGYVSRIGEQGGLAEGSQYVVHLHKIIELLRQNEVEGIVLQRYGQECCRIFRLLGLNGQLEQKQIGERAMVPKDVRELLYRLLKDHYVQVQEVAKTTERVASKSIHLWCVDNQAVLHQVLDDIYHAASNLSQRLAHELEKEQQIHVPNANLTNSQQEQVKRIQSIMTVLEASLLKLDNAMLLFHDF